MAFNVTFQNQTKRYDKPVIASDVIGDCKDYVCVKINNRIRELTYPIDKTCEIEALTCSDRAAMRIYEASLRFLVAMAMENIAPGVKFRFSYNISRSVFMQLLDKKTSANTSLTLKLVKEMERLVKEDIPLIRNKLPKDEAIALFEQLGYEDKAELIKYRPEKTAHVYTCGNYKNYMYERMVPSTGYINKWKIRFYSPGIIIQYPRSECNGQIPEFQDAPTYGRTLKRAHNWAALNDIDTVPGINQMIKTYGSVDFINMCEHMHNRQFSEIGDLIEQDIDSLRLICIAGPSSSGKTTFANRLRIELLSRA